jgi:serine/threonine protein kinase
MQKGTPTSDRIGGYRVLRQLSVMGPVQIHLACEEGPEKFSRKVVLKIVPIGSGREADDTRELIREVTTSAELTHPGIVRTHQTFLHDDAVVFVLEHLEGLSLAELLARHTTSWRRCLSDDAALYLGLCICDALAHAHAMVDEEGFGAPIVHRAVSPSSVLIGRDGMVKLDGFGFANILGGVTTDAADGPTWTPAYLAPEQIARHEPGPENDVYTAGLLLWELLTGRTATILPRDPFAIEATFEAVARRKLEPLASLRPDIAPELASAINAALAPTPERRIVTCAEMARIIRKVSHLSAGKAELRESVNAALGAATKESRTTRGDELSLPEIRGAGQLFSVHSSDATGFSDPPASTADTTDEASGSEQVSSGTWEWSSLVRRLHAPTPWRRNSWIAAWVGLTLCLVTLAAKLSLPRTPRPSFSAIRNTVGETFGAPATPSFRAEAPPPVEAPTPPAASTVALVEPASNAEAPALEVDSLSTLPALAPGFGLLTVHSTASHASVYVDQKLSGSPEEKLSVRCGKRFVSIGIPARLNAKPTWLAPGKMMVIPCGAALETTMNTRALR